MTASTPTPSASFVQPRQAGPWTCIAGVTAYVGVSPLILRGSIDAPLWIVLWLAIGAIAIGVVTVGAVRSARSGREQLDELNRLDIECHDLAELAETRREALESLVEQQLPAFANGAAPPPIPDVTTDEVSAGLLNRAVPLLARLREDQRNRQDGVHAAVVALGRKVQASAHRIQEEAARMVQRHPADGDVLHTSMRVDHAAAQQARNAQSLAALCGEWPGQQWHDALPLADVVRGAAGRITAYQRVEVSGDPSVAVSARVVEPLIHVIAELLANATQSSPPTTQVLVSLRQVQRGAVIEIDDGGVGLDDSRLEQVREIASGRRPVGLADLGEIPQTGLPVVGAYVRRHGFRVDVTESVYGGLRAIVLVPTELTEAIAPAGMVAGGGHALTRRAERQSGQLEAVPVDSAIHTAIPAPTSGDLPALPRRRSRRGTTAPATASSAAVPAAVDWPAEQQGQRVQSAEEAGQWMSAFLNAAGRVHDLDAELNPEPEPKNDVAAGSTTESRMAEQTPEER